MKKIILTGLVLTLVLSGCTIGGKPEKVMKPEAARQKAEEFINKNFIKGDAKATVDLPVIENGLYKFNVNIPGGETPIESYMALNGSKIFPQAIAMEEPAQAAADNANNNQESAPTADLPKSEKPKVEVFVMSYCPYSTQMEKGILPVAEALGNKIDFEIKFVNYAMHGEKEVKEQTAQYCIKKEQKDKFNPYLKCFLKAGDQASCLKSEKIDQSKLNSCITSADKQYKITQNFNDKSTWKGDFPQFNINKAENDKYGVQGSPTLVVNGKQAESNRDSASLLKTICSAFRKAPSECSKQLSAAAPAPGFGEGQEASGNSGGDCGTPN